MYKKVILIACIIACVIGYYAGYTTRSTYYHKDNRDTGTQVQDAEYAYCVDYLRETYPDQVFDIVSRDVSLSNTAIFTVLTDDDKEVEFTVFIMHNGNMLKASDTLEKGVKA